MVLYQSRHDATEYGRLAQLVEHLLDVQEVTGSSPVPSTITEASAKVRGSFFVSAANTRWRFVDKDSKARHRRRRGKNSPVDCFLVRGWWSPGMSTNVVRTRFFMKKGSGTFFVYRMF